MKDGPAFQLYASDLYIDTNTWTTHEVGVYTRLLVSEWANGPLPDNAEKLARAAGCSVKKFLQAWPVVREKFQNGSYLESKSGSSIEVDCTLSGIPQLINPRLEIERQKQRKYRELQSQKGKLSVEARVNRGLNRCSTDVLTEPQPSSSSSSSSSLLLNLFKDYCKDLIQPQELSEDRKRKITTRLKRHPDLEWWKDVFTKANEVCIPGKDGKSDWCPTFDWLIDNDKNALKVKEGNYSPKTKGQHKQQGAENLLRRLEDEERGSKGICEITGSDGGGIRGSIK